MAASLNTPKDFSHCRSKDAISNDIKNPELLPPSCFQATSQDDPWKTLSETTKEVMKLRLENQKLRDRKEVTVPAREEIHARVDVQQSHISRFSDLRAYEDIITRQASEIADQKTQFNKMETELRRQVAQLENQLLSANNQNTQRVTLLHGQMRTLEAKHQEKICQMSLAHEEELKTEQEILTKLKQELSEVNATYTHKVAALEMELSQSRMQQIEMDSEMKQKISSSREHIEQLESQLSQVRVYLGEAQKDSSASQTWKHEKAQLQHQLQTLEEEKSGLESSVNLLNIRLTSVNEILTIHEKEISKTKGDLNDVDSKKSLLTRWREQVYALLVQRKSTEIVHKKDRHNWMQKMTLLEAELESLKNQISVLNHALSDKMAELDMERNNTKTLQSELTKTQQVALALDDQRQTENEALTNLQEYAKSVIEKYLMADEQMQKALAILTAHSQRLNFAAGRLDMLQGQFARKEALLKMQLSGTELPQSAAEKQAETTSQQDETIGEQMRTELLRVTMERDTLANQVKEDAASLQEKIKEVKGQCADQISSLENQVEELTKFLDEKSEKCRTLSEAREGLQREVDDSAEEIEQLKLDIAKQKIASEKILEEQRAENLVSFRDQMVQMERKINDARREQTKAVVALRQLERQSARDKDKVVKELENTREVHREEIAHLLRKVHAVESERNLYMSTLRQEGLIGKLRAVRGVAVSLNDDEECAGTINATQTDEPKPSAEVAEPLTNVLNDLEDLTAAALEEDHNLSDEDEDHT